MFVFDSEVWCDTCGESYQSVLLTKGMAPKNIANVDSYDSAVFPKYVEEPGKSKLPLHCCSMEKCPDAITLSNGEKVGKWLENDLTDWGHRHIESLNEYEPEHPTVKLWAALYA